MTSAPRWQVLLAIACGSVALVSAGDLWQPVAAVADDVPAYVPVHSLVRWDAGWYGEIAQNGYWVRPGAQSPVAFFPLYPLVIRALAVVGVNRWLAGALVSFACALAALALFRRWATRALPASAPTATWALALYPFAVYLYGVLYSDALFLLLAVGAFVALEEDRPVLAALLGALAAATRPVAPALVVGLLARSLERRRRAGVPLRVLDFVPALAGLGLLAFMAYLELRFDDPLAFAHVQGAPGWDQPPGWEAWLKVPWFKTMFPRVAPLVAVRLGGHALVTLGALALCVPTFRRLGWGYGLYCLAVVGLPALSSKDFQGLGRYVIAAFPLFLTWASLLDARPRARLAWLAASAIALALLAVALGAGGYVA